jgi:hypothetical protein
MKGRALVLGATLVATAAGAGAVGFELWSRSRVRTLPIPAGRALAFSPTGERLAVGDATGVSLRSVETGAELGALLPTDRAIETVAFSPRDDAVAAGCWYKLMLAPLGKASLTLDTLGTVWIAAFSPSGTRLAAESTQDGVFVVDVAHGSLENRRGVAKVTSYHIAFVDENTLAVVSELGSHALTVYSLDPIAPLASVVTAGSRGGFAANGHRYACAAESRVEVFSLPSCAQVARFAVEPGFDRAALSAEGDVVAIWSSNAGRLEIHSLPDGGLLRRWPSATTTHVSTAVFSPTRDVVAVAADGGTFLVPFRR